MTFQNTFLRRLPAFIVIALLAAACAIGYLHRNLLVWAFFQVRFPGKAVARQGLLASDLGGGVRVLASGLDAPWAIGFLPDDSVLVTERRGALKRIGQDGVVHDVTGLEGTKAVGEGGLLGLAIHPRFSENRWIYLYQTAQAPDGLQNRVMRYRLKDDALSEATTVVQGIPASSEHDGGALAFGPDGRLYIGTGDAGNAPSAQDLGSLAGKILRVNDDGSVPSGNPFGTPVWSYGHRNVQGLARDSLNRLWATEHGRSGLLRTGLDELNLIEAGANYGWPVIEGDETADGLRTAAVHSGSSEPWAPAGSAVAGGNLFFGGLRGEALYQAKIGATPIPVLANFEGEFGRIRAVAAGPDGKLYFTTSNTDGRGLPRPDDDRLIRIEAARFQ